MINPNEIQIGGDHYQQTEIQHWDVMITLKARYMMGVMTKYLARFERKNGLEDLHKVQHYLTKYNGKAGLLWRLRTWWHRGLVQQWLGQVKASSELPQSVETYRQLAIRALLSNNKSEAQHLVSGLVYAYEEFISAPDQRYTNQD